MDPVVTLTAASGVRGVLRAIFKRPRSRSVLVTVGGQRMELSAASAEDNARLVEQFIASTTVPVAEAPSPPAPLAGRHRDPQAVPEKPEDDGRGSEGEVVILPSEPHHAATPDRNANDVSSPPAGVPSPPLAKTAGPRRSKRQTPTAAIGVATSGGVLEGEVEQSLAGDVLTATVVGPVFKLVFLSILGITLLAFVTNVFLVVADSGQDSPSMTNLVDTCSTITKLGFGAIVGLLGGKTIAS